VPFSATFRSIVAAYTLAWALSDKFGGKVRDPQLGGAPSVDLARQEWKKHQTTGELSKIFGGTIPGDFKAKIRQRRGLRHQDIEIQGTELEISRRQPGRSVHYYLPILSLGPVQESRAPNPRGWLLLAPAWIMLILTIVLQTNSIGGILFLATMGFFVSSFVIAYKRKRRVLGFPGRGGNLLLESASPSKKEVEQFLTSIDRVRFAVSRYQPARRVEPSETDSENMRIA